MGLKLKETEYGNLTNTFPPANHFFKAKARIQRSDVFKIIRKLPKGISCIYSIDGEEVDNFLTTLQKTFNPIFKQSGNEMAILKETVASSRCLP